MSSPHPRGWFLRPGNPGSASWYTPPLVLVNIFLTSWGFRGGFRIRRRRGRQPSRRGRQHTNLPDFPEKLHEIKKILVCGGRPLGSATGFFGKFSKIVCWRYHLIPRDDPGPLLRIMDPNHFYLHRRLRNCFSQGPDTQKRTLGVFSFARSISWYWSKTSNF